MPIHYAAMVGALALLWLKVMTPREAYASIDWQVLLMLYGLLGLGMAMQNTGTAVWLARGLVDIAGEHSSRAEYMPIVMLWLIFLLTLLAHRGAVQQRHRGDDDSHRRHAGGRAGGEFAAVHHRRHGGASCAFALPMGYQTHMMVYGPGGYRFTDFLRVGIPLNIICWITSCTADPADLAVSKPRHPP